MNDKILEFEKLRAELEQLNGIEERIKKQSEVYAYWYKYIRPICPPDYRSFVN